MKKLKKKYNVYIYGAGNMYNQLINYINLYKDYINILGIITSNPICYKKIDGYDCITIDEVYAGGGVDFFIIAVEKWKEIFRILIKKGIDEKKIIRGSVFKLPNFDFEEYIRLKNNNVSILSNYCLGGILYDKLGLKYISPTINMYCAGERYLDFLEEYEYYLNCEMKEVQLENYVDGTISLETFWLKGILDNKIVWNFNHSTDIKKAITQWNVRKARFNYFNVAALMVIQSDRDAIRFEKLKIRKKLGIYYKDLNLKHVVYIPEWHNNSEMILRYIGNWPNFANEYMAGINGHISPINWIKFFLGDELYYRKLL